MEVAISTIDEGHWARIQELFDAALKRPVDQRADFLQQTDVDQTVRQEVEDLLTAFEAGEDELELPPFARSIEQAMTGDPTIHLPNQLDGYHVLGEIYRGGQGVVYKAVQESTKRDVALKVIYAGPHADPAARRRFEREVELAGSLRHPGIVRIYDSGLASGQYYCVMEYLDGDRLDEYVFQRQLSQRQILELFIPICAAVNHAHRRGVIHRDLKPSNVIVDSQGNPHLVDFGLAKLTESTADDTLQVSFTGQVMGTVNYMSPEQASGRPDSIDTRSDVYSLAVILYQLLSGQLPYALGVSLTKDLVTIQTVDPTPMRSVQRDLETVIRKALSKDPDRRYQTAGEFGDDVQRCLRGEPIEAKRDSILYVLRKAASRHRFVTAAFLGSVTVIVLAAIVGWGLYLDAQQASHAAGIASHKYRVERDKARELRDTSQRMRYFVEMDLAGRLLNDSGGFPRICEIASRWQTEPDFPEEYRGWEWYYVNSRINRHFRELRVDHPLYCARFSPDGTWIAFGDDSGKVQLCLTHDMSQLIELGKHEHVVRSVCWSPNGRFVASGAIDHKVFVFDVQAKKQVLNFAHEDHVISLAWHPQLPLLASSSNDGIVRVWEIDTGSLDQEFDIGTGAQSLDWSADGSRLLVGTWQKKAYIWDLNQKKLLKNVSGYAAVINRARWNGSGQLIAAGEDNGDLAVNRVRNGSLAWRVSTRRNVLDICWSPDSSSFASVGVDRSIRIWAARNPRVLRKIDGHGGAIWSIDWSADGQWLLSASLDQTLKIWKAEDPSDDRILQIRGEAPISSIAWSPDDSRIAVGSDLSAISLFDAQTAKLLEELDAGYGARLQTVSWNPEGTRLGSGGWDEKAVIWDAQTGSKILERDHHSGRMIGQIPNVVHRVSWSPDGKKIASCGHDSIILIWDSESGELLNEYSEQSGIVYSLDWHPKLVDRIAVSTSIHGAWIWDLSQPEPHRIETGGIQTRCIRWSPNGSQFAVCRDDGLVTIHDAETYDVQVTLKGHLGQVFHVGWHPEGNRLATASEDGTARVWDVSTGTQTIAFDSLQGPVFCVAFSNNGTSLAIGGQSGFVQIFDATLGYTRLSSDGEIPQQSDVASKRDTD